MWLFLALVVSVSSTLDVALTVVDLRPVSSMADKVTIQVCAGLLNRASIPVYTVKDTRDLDWLKDIEGISNPSMTPVESFLSQCISEKDDDGAPLVHGYVQYNYTAQHANVPNLFTLAAVLDALPLEVGQPQISKLSLVLNVTAEWKSFSEYDSTKYMYENYFQRTTGLAFMNPGWDSKNPLKPVLTGQPDISLADYIVKMKLFNFFLLNACIPETQDHALMAELTSTNPWPKPTTVYGYNNAWPIAGDLFEAETNCNSQHNIGQVATQGMSNLAFFSRKPAISTPVTQNDTPKLVFNASKTYISFVMGDGDNVAYLRGERRDWFLERQSKCQQNPSDGCFPLLWSISPHTLYLAPDLLQWYYNQSHASGTDYFVLPPSGHLYAYPAMMDAKDQAQFVKDTESDAVLMNTQSTTHWDFTGTWYRSINEYLPQYSERGLVQGFFCVNVPYMIPVPEFGAKEFYKVLGEKKNVVAFKPREWRGTTSSNPLTKQFFYTPTEMAAVLNGHPKGTVSSIYVTSDGGWNLDTLYSTVPLLEEHVVLIDHNNLIQMALAAADK